MTTEGDCTIAHKQLDSQAWLKLDELRYYTTDARYGSSSHSEVVNMAGRSGSGSAATGPDWVMRAQHLRPLSEARVMPVRGHDALCH